jgi:hypothetical protein
MGQMSQQARYYVAGFLAGTPPDYGEHPLLGRQNGLHQQTSHVQFTGGLGASVEPASCHFIECERIGSVPGSAALGLSRDCWKVGESAGVLSVGW